MPNSAFVLAISGGPTPVANASIVGACRELQSAPGVGPVLGARFGLEGILNEHYLDLSALSPRQLAELARTPGAALGSSRYRPSDEELERAVQALGRLEVRWLVVVGGNDSAHAMHRLHEAAAARNVPLGIVGVPKTVDNDLPHTDHCLGYGSAARMVALAVRGTARDTSAMRGTDPVKVIEVAGRNSGWLAAAAALGRRGPDDAPHLMYLPERPRALRRMVAEVGDVLQTAGFAVVVLSENQKGPDGGPLAGGETIAVDPYGHPYQESPGVALARALREDLGVNARAERPGNILRSLSGMQSAADLRESLAAGADAARRALAGESDVSVVIERPPGAKYEAHLAAVPLAWLAGQERRLEPEFIAPSGTDVTPAFLRYARPLVGRLPPVVDFV